MRGFFAAENKLAKYAWKMPFSGENQGFFMRYDKETGILPVKKLLRSAWNGFGKWKNIQCELHDNGEWVRRDLCII